MNKDEIVKNFFSKKKDKYLFSSKEIGAHFGIREEEMQKISRIFKIGEKIGYWVYRKEDVRILAEMLDKYGRKGQDV